MIGKFFDALRHARLKNAGRRGEDLAHRFLRREGFIIVARNYRLASGEAEADLIAWEGETLAIVEVKSRATEEFGDPARAIDERKRRNLMKVAHAYSRKRGVEWAQVRIDLVSVVLSDPPKLRLDRGAISTTRRHQ
jgi:putative endonuclease